MKKCRFRECQIAVNFNEIELDAKHGEIAYY